MQLRSMAIACLLGFVGCAHTQPSTPSSISVGDKGATYDAAVRVVVEDGFEVATKDRDAGVVQTAWRTTTSEVAAALSATTSSRERVVITIANGTATVKLDYEVCSRASALEQGPGRCTNYGRMTDEMAARQQSIATRIAAASAAATPAAATPAAPAEAPSPAPTN